MCKTPQELVIQLPTQDHVGPLMKLSSKIAAHGVKVTLLIQNSYMKNHGCHVRKGRCYLRAVITMINQVRESKIEKHKILYDLIICLYLREKRLLFFYRISLY